MSSTQKNEVSGSSSRDHSALLLLGRMQIKFDVDFSMRGDNQSTI